MKLTVVAGCGHFVDVPHLNHSQDPYEVLKHAQEVWKYHVCPSCREKVRLYNAFNYLFGGLGR